MQEDLPQMLQLARENAVVGMYESSMAYFDQAIAAIQNLMTSSETQHDYKKWERTLSFISEEQEVVQNIQQTISGFKLDKPIAQSRSERPLPVHREKPQGQFQIEVKNPNYRGPVNIERLKGAPFNNQPSELPLDIYNKAASNPPSNYPSSPARAPPKAPPKPPTKIPRNPPAKRPSINPPKPPAPAAPRRATSLEMPPPKQQIKKRPSAPQEQAQKPSFLEANQNNLSADVNLIQMIENDVLDSSPNINFEDIASLDDAKMLLQEAVLLPQLMPEFFQGIRRPWKGILMFGPPGTGKTLLAKAIATTGRTKFFSVSAATLASKWRGESEKLVRILFEMARYYSPSTIFFDEIDAVGSRRGGGSEHEASRRVKTELLVQMDGAGSDEGQVIVLAATNRPWDLDEALLRRLEKRIYIPLPSDQGRLELFTKNLSGVPLEQGIKYDFLVKRSKGYSAADIVSVCRDASMIPMRRQLQDMRNQAFNTLALDQLKSGANVAISMEDLKTALRNVNKSVSERDLEKYAKWMAEFGSA